MRRESRCIQCKSDYGKQRRGRVKSPEDYENARQKRRAWYVRNKEREQAKQAADRRAVKKQTIAAYGGFCVCCGEADLDFLTIDHVDGSGADFRSRTHGISGDGFYRYLRKRGFPQGNHQVLCFNCNCAKGFYGQCPHIALRRELLSVVEAGNPLM